jgi:chemotaxis protein methyltransferase CheR
MLAHADTELLIEKINHWYGYDFSGYARASLRRRIEGFYLKNKFSSYGSMELALEQDPACFTRFVEEITVNVTEMFRDPGFYRTLREKILPVLATYPFIRIWHAGCSTGEEVYSMAILLSEASLLHKSILYATDVNQAVLEQARTGIFAGASMQQYSENYMLSGGQKDFSSYYSANYSSAKFAPWLSERIIFSSHNLVADSSFNEFQLILCRNVLIYFDKQLQVKVLQLFDKSLDSLGFLALGSKESIRFSGMADRYRQVDPKEKIWRKSR